MGFLTWLTSRPPHRIYQLIAIIDVALIVTVLAIWLFPPRARFAIDASTEIATIAIPTGDRMPSWGDIPIYALPPAPDMIEDPALAGCPGPSLRLAAKAQRAVTLTWVIEAERLQLTMNADGASLGTLSCGGAKPRPAPDYLVARWPIAGAPPATLRFSGDLVVGGETSSNAQSGRLLREGSLSVEANSWPFGSGRVSSKMELTLGDQVRFLASAGHAAQVFGIIRAQGDNVRIIGYADAYQAQVLRAGQEHSEPLVVAPSFFARLQAQAEWAVALIIAALVLNFLTALIHISQSRAHKDGSIAG